MSEHHIVCEYHSIPGRSDLCITSSYSAKQSALFIWVVEKMSISQRVKHMGRYNGKWKWARGSEFRSAVDVHPRFDRNDAEAFAFLVFKNSGDHCASQAWVEFQHYGTSPRWGEILKHAESMFHVASVLLD